MITQLKRLFEDGLDKIQQLIKAEIRLVKSNIARPHAMSD